MHEYAKVMLNVLRRDIEKGTTVYQISRETGIDQGLLSRLLNKPEDHKMGIDTLQRLGDHYGYVLRKK